MSEETDTPQPSRQERITAWIVRIGWLSASWVVYKYLTSVGSGHPFTLWPGR